MTTRRRAVRASLGISTLVLAGAALSGPATAEPFALASSPTTASPITASAPCSGRADVSIRLTDDPLPHRATKVVVRVTNARPGSRWDTYVSVEWSDSGQGQVGYFYANDAGVVRIRTYGESGRNTVEVRMTSRAGQTCGLSLSGVVSRA
ncbi:MAG: hypothetical protein ACR2LE_10755 [Nocardioidaceae bacterium]